MDCKEFNHIIDKIIDNDITETEEALYKEHISKCSMCKDDLEVILKINEELEELSMQDPPQNFTSQVVSRAKKEGLISTKTKQITVLSKFAMAVASFLFLFLLLDYTILPFYDGQDKLNKDQDLGAQHYEEDMRLESEDYSLDSLDLSDRKLLSAEQQRDGRGLRNTIVFVSAIILSAPFITEVYKRKTSY